MALPPADTRSLEQQNVVISALLNDLAQLDSGTNALPRLSRLQSGPQSLIDLLDCALVAMKADEDSYWKLLRALRNICGHWKLLPSSHVLPERLSWEHDIPIARGDAADVWVGTYRNKLVAIKSMRGVTRNNLGEIMKFQSFFEEVVLWKHLSHPNIMPFLGVPISELFPLSMVSPWMVNGNVTEYLRANPDTNRHSLLIDVCNGIQFLHSLEITHGDLKATNILINSNGKACLIDFRRASIGGDLEMVNDSTNVSYPCETYRWLAPELLNNFNSGPSKASDIYALAMVILELFSGKLPFHYIPETAVPFRVAIGMRPGRPDQALNKGLSDEIWELVQRCWDHNMTKRPTISFFLERLRVVAP